jgi:hypothetical protein
MSLTIYKYSTKQTTVNKFREWIKNVLKLECRIFLTHNELLVERGKGSLNGISWIGFGF